jgi:hypothetical protein
MVKKSLVIKLKNNTKIASPLLVVSFVLAIILSTTILLPFQAVKAQNVTVQLENATESDQVPSTVIQTLATPGFGNKYDVTYKGITAPINYNIIGGAVVGMLGDPQRHALYVVVTPGNNGGALEIALPRNALDAKTTQGMDASYLVKIDGQRISGEPSGICIGTCPNIFNTFKATGNTNTDRTLTIIFGPESRFIEIVGNSGV